MYFPLYLSFVAEFCFKLALDGSSKLPNSTYSFSQILLRVSWFTAKSRDNGAAKDVNRSPPTDSPVEPESSVPTSTPRGPSGLGPCPSPNAAGGVSVLLGSCVLLWLVGTIPPLGFCGIHVDAAAGAIGCDPTAVTAFSRILCENTLCTSACTASLIWSDIAETTVSVIVCCSPLVSMSNRVVDCSFCCVGESGLGASSLLTCTTWGGGGAHNFLVCEVSFSSKFLWELSYVCCSSFSVASCNQNKISLAGIVTVTHDNHVETNIIDIDLTRTPWPASFINKVDCHVA